MDCNSINGAFMSGAINGTYPRGFSKPNLFIIGASKAGTSSLHEYLALHPQISMSRVKETNFFLESSAHDINVVPKAGSKQTPFDLYLRLFSRLEDAQYAGESSPGYTWYPHFSGVSQRLFEFNRDAKLIYLVRDPVERAISHYWYWCMKGGETRSPMQAFRENDIYRDVSNYPLQLSQYLGIFPQEQIYICTLEDLAAQPLETMKSVFKWLALPVPAEISEDSFRKRENETPPVVMRPRRGLAALRQTRIFKQLRVLSPAPIRRKIWELVGKSAVNRRQTDMTECTKYLQEALLPHAEEFERLCGRSFRQWRTVWKNAPLKNAASQLNSSRG